MSEAYTTPVIEILSGVMAASGPDNAKEIFEEADFYCRTLLDAIAGTGYMMAGVTADTPIDPAPDEWQAMGNSLRALAVLAKGFHSLTEQYRWRQLNGELPLTHSGGGDAR